MHNLQNKINGKKCDLCGSSQAKFLFASHDRMFPEIKGTYNLFECEICGLMFIHPSLSQKQLSKHYPEDYSVFNRNDEINHLRKIFSLVESLYLYSEYKSDKFNFLKLLQILFYPMKSLFRNMKIVENGNFLDVGCGLGYFLLTMKNLGMNPYGIEPGKIDYELADKYNLNIYNENLLDIKFDENFFDVISLNHVFEHVSNPSETMKELSRILKKDGYLIIRIPLADSYAFKFFGRYWGQLDTPRHLFIFTSENLKKYGLKNGFEIENIRYCSNPPFQIISSIFYKIEDMNNIKFDRKMSQNLFLIFLFLPISAFLNIIKKGDECEVTFKKI